jgi:hypothetical protein
MGGGYPDDQRLIDQPFQRNDPPGLALGLGTMIGWKRIVVTVGKKVGKDHLTYAQGGVAGITAMATIMTVDGLGLPVSTTHVLSGVANHGGQPHWPPVGDCAQFCAGLGAHTAGGNAAVRLPLLGLPKYILEKPIRERLDT